MNRVIHFVLGSLALLLACSTASGQGCFQPHFGIYTSVVGDGYTIHTAVTMEGYTTVNCSMTSATHKVEAENVISTTGGWTSSGSGCPTCYFSVTGNDTFTGVSGEIYNWVWDGEAVCTVFGTFLNNGGTGSLPGCLVPSTEDTDDQGWNGSIYRELFEMTLSDTNGDSFDSHTIQEYTVQPGTNTCWWNGSGLVQYPETQNSHWTVGASTHNQWGFDEIGWDLTDLDNIVQNGPRNGVSFPCVATIYQGMQIECNANLWWNYRTDAITITVNNVGDNTEENCRAGECGVPVTFSYQMGGQRKTWWALIFKPVDSSGPPRSSPQIKAVKEAR